MGTGSPALRLTRRRAGALASAPLAAAALVFSAATASAAPQPTVNQILHKLDQLKSAEDVAIQRYDQAKQDLANARQRLAMVTREASADQAQLHKMRARLAQFASFAYEDGNLTSFGALMTSPNAQTVLSQSSYLQHLSSDQATQLKQVLATVGRYNAAKRLAQRAATAVTALKKQELARWRTVNAQMLKQEALFNELSGQQQAALNGGTTHAIYTGPTNTPAERAVAFAYAQLGKPYVWGATGPDTYDCSGLVQRAWESVGVAIPRTTYDQWAALPHISMSQIRPGDLIFFDAIGHVGMYVGNNDIIDAPQPGEDVELISLSDAWYADNLDGAARP